jgi:cytochrome bd-type quinol oxidase subunit 2
MSTARNADSTTHNGHRGWPEIASTVALVLAAGVALEVLVDLISTLSRDDIDSTSGKIVLLASGLSTTVAFLLIAAVLVLVHRALGGADDRSRMAAMIIAITALVVAVILVIGLLMSFDDGVLRTQPWATRVHLLLGAIAALAAAALANEARDNHRAHT